MGTGPSPVRRTLGGAAALFAALALAGPCPRGALASPPDPISPRDDQEVARKAVVVLARWDGVPVRDLSVAPSGAKAGVVTGGQIGPRAIDVLYDGKHFSIFDSTQVTTTNTRGVSCTFATGLACLLARSLPLPEAVDETRRYVAKAANHPYRIGKGEGPLHHLPSTA